MKQPQPLSRLALVLHIISIIAIAALAWQVYWHNRNQTYRALSHDLTTARLNNLKECYNRGDKDCPEGKYSDSAKIIEQLRQHSAGM